MESKTREIMSRIFGISADDIAPDMSPADIENWDSLRHMNLVLALEEEFGVEFDESALDDLTSQQKILEELQKLV